MDPQNDIPRDDDMQAPEDELSEQELDQVTGGLFQDIMPFGPGPGIGGVPMPLPPSTEPGGRTPPSEP